MSDHKILFTGDFWNADFQSILSEFQVPVTLVPIEKAKTLTDASFDLVVIAQARRGQFSAADVEELQAVFSTTPIIALLGSWCEGETRSGDPWPGVPRVYWHQFEGRYQKFAKQLEGFGITDWHSPKTSTVADRIVNSRNVDNLDEVSCVAISAWTHQKHSMVADAVSHFGWSNLWVERAVWNSETSAAVDVILIEADAWSEDLVNRIKWVRQQVPGAPLVLIANYPRENQVEVMKVAGVTEVVSKPFELDGLKAAVLRAAKSFQDAQFDPVAM